MLFNSNGAPTKISFANLLVSTLVPNSTPTLGDAPLSNVCASTKFIPLTLTRSPALINAVLPLNMYNVDPITA